jgi:hypothetical protein
MGQAFGYLSRDEVEGQIKHCLQQQLSQMVDQKISGDSSHAENASDAPDAVLGHSWLHPPIILFQQMADT